MKKFKIAAILSYIAAIGWYITSIICYTHESSSKGTMYLCMGSAMACMGFGSLIRYRKEKSNDKLNDKEQNKSED